MQTEKHYISYTGYSPLYPRQDEKSRKICDIPPGHIVQRIMLPETKDGWVEVLYKTNTKTFRGFTFAEYVSPFIDKYEPDIINIENPTSTESDFAQNLILWGRTQYNLCGEFCVMFCMGWTRKNRAKISIEEWLESWKSIPLSTGYLANTFRRAFPSLRSAPTGIQDLLDMVDLFETDEKPLLLSDLYEKRGKILFNPETTRSILKERYILIGCLIDSVSGRLSNKGISHWVVITDIEMNGRGGIVTIFNSTSNTHEDYTWEQIKESCRTPKGIGIKK